MRFTSLVSPVAVLAAADAASGAAPAPAAKPATKRVIKPGKSAKKPGKPAAAKPEAKPTKPVAADKPAETHQLANSYRGPSPVFRGHARKLSVIVLGRTAGAYTDRDHAALKALHGKFGTKPFHAYDTDRGVISRLEAHGLLKHVDGDLALRDCRFAVTAKAVSTKLGTAKAPTA